MDGRFQSLISYIEQQFACFLGVTRAKEEVVLVSRVAQFQFRCLENLQTDYSFLLNNLHKKPQSGEANSGMNLSNYMSEKLINKASLYFTFIILFMLVIAFTQGSDLISDNLR